MVDATNTMMLAGDDTTGQGFARMLQLDQSTAQHDEIHVEENEDDGQGEDSESKGEEDDVMDDEEYKRLIDKRNKKNTQVRFSMLVNDRPKGAVAGERRMTVFNPKDPNNAMGFKFLRKNTSRNMLPSIKSKSKAGGKDAESDLDDTMN
jgi:hypothetical protein